MKRAAPNLQHLLGIALSVFLAWVLQSNFSTAAVPSLVADFGAVSVNASGAPLPVAVSLAGISATPSLVIGGIDFTSGALACNGAFTICTANVTFAPRTAGVKQDALLLKDSAGKLLATAFLHGIGAAPELRALPAVIATLAGNGVWGYADAPALSASFRNPQGLAVDLAGNIYIADSINQVVRKLATNGAVTTIAGNNNAGFSGDGGPATSATLNTPTDVAVDAAGNLFIADQGNSLIRRVDVLTHIITTVAGGGNNTANGAVATTASLSGPNNLAIDTSGNIYIADSFHNLIRKVTAATGLIATVAGGGASAGTDGLGDGGPAISAQLSNPTGIALDSLGNLYLSDTGNRMVRRVDATSGIITVAAGTGVTGSSGDGASALNATLSSPAGLALDAAGNLYLADSGAHIVRFVNAATGFISTIAGNRTAAYSGDGGIATSASLNGPSDVALTVSGVLLIADYANNVVRKVTYQPPALQFPSTNVNLISALSPVTIANYGNATLNLTSLVVTNGFSQSRSGGTDCTASLALVSGATCTLGVAFTPTAAGAVTGSVTLGSNSENQSASQFILSLAGTGLSGTPVANLSTTSVTFAGQAVGVASASQTITVSNTGTATLGGLNIQLSGQNTLDFNLTTTCQTTLAASSNCSIFITFNPQLSGARTAAVTIFDSAANSPQTVTLTGVGTGGPVAAFNSTSLIFGTQTLGATSPAQNLTLSNTGSASLGISSISVTGPQSADFQVTATTCGGALAPSATCAVTLDFAPTAAGARSANLQFVLVNGNSVQSVSLSGVGVSGPCVTAVNSTNAYLAAGATGSLTVNAPTGCSWTALSTASWITLNSSPNGSGATNLSFTIAANSTAQPRTAAISVGGQAQTITQFGVGLRFVPMTPCRAIDTRTPTGPFGAPALTGNVARDFILPSSACGIPSTAQAYALNITVVPKGVLGYLGAWPSGLPQPQVSTLNSDGRAKANAAVIPAGSNGGITILASDPSDVIVDVSGYFVLASTSSALAFYPLAPCRVVDTRLVNGALGLPHLSALRSRDFPLLSSACNIPSTAQAYSLNFTVVPRGANVGYLSAWPAGQAQPYVSTLNDYTGTVVANAALVQAGDGGSISVFATDDAEVIIDINGYFAPPATGGLSLYNLTPCRALDTRLTTAGQPINGTLNVNLLTAPACTLPTQAQSYVLNATVVPQPTLGVLTLWPSGQPQPQVSTLNAFDGAVTSNMALLPTASSVLNVYTSSSSHVILDLFAYFGP